MADNVPITAGSGTTIATDDVAGVHYQQVKIVNGTLDSAIAAIVSAAGELQVKLTAATATVPISAAAALDVSAATVPVNQTRPSTATCTNVAASASSVQLLALNTSRRDSTFYNDADKAVRIKLGTTASATSFTVKLAAGEYYECPYGYTGRIDAIWDAAPTGSMRVTELT